MCDNRNTNNHNSAYTLIAGAPGRRSVLRPKYDSKALLSTFSITHLAAATSSGSLAMRSCTCNTYTVVISPITSVLTDVYTVQFYIVIITVYIVITDSVMAQSVNTFTLTVTSGHYFAACLWLFSPWWS